MHDAIYTPTFLVDRLNDLVVLSATKTNSYAGIFFGKDKESRVSCCDRPQRLNTSIHTGGSASFSSAEMQEEIIMPASVVSCRNPSALVSCSGKNAPTPI